MVTLTGFVHVFSTGPDSKGVSVADLRRGADERGLQSRGGAADRVHRRHRARSRDPARVRLRSALTALPTARGMEISIWIGDVNGKGWQ